MGKIIIFSDGSSRGNPGPGGWGSIVAVGGKIAELGGADTHTTNNRMELTASIEALKSLKNNKGEVELHTDSSYVINGITKWVYGWQKNGWISSQKEDVVNRDLWEELITVSKDKKIKWVYVAGHTGVCGNERCDEIATAYADGKEIKLFNGKLPDYEIDLSCIKTDVVRKSSKKNSGPAYSYLSLVNGKFNIDKTWAECEKRVKGIKGNVKFKKALSPSDEKEIKKEWGVK